MIRDEPALIGPLISVELRSLVRMTFTSVLQRMLRSQNQITPMNFNTFPETYFANLVSEMVSFGTDPL